MGPLWSPPLKQAGRYRASFLAAGTAWAAVPDRV
jgi:hypothetical protein